MMDYELWMMNDVASACPDACLPAGRCCYKSPFFSPFHKGGHRGILAIGKSPATFNFINILLVFL